MSEENDTKPEGTATPAPKKKAAPRKRATAAKKPTAKAATAKPAAKKAAARKPAAKPKAAAETADAKAHAEAPKAEAPKPEPQAAPSGASGTISEDAQEFISELKEKDWGSYLVRGIFMLVFGFLSWLAISFCFLLAGIQFIVLILTGGPNDLITRTIMTAGNYIADVMAYLSFKTDERPFPLGKQLPVEED